jgi:5-methylcytosine-specific restriction endonuclease McrA
MLTNETSGIGQSSDARNVFTRQKLLIQFLANKEFMKKYEEVRALLSQRLSNTSFERVFDAVLEEFLERHCPTRRKARRDKRRATPRKPCNAAAQKKAKSRPHSRLIPTAVRDKVFTRDRGRCTYVGKTGKRCGSTQALQIDHIKPFTRWGTNAPSNLRLLCAKHNRLAAQEAFGEELMKRFPRRE